MNFKPFLFYLFRFKIQLYLSKFHIQERYLISISRFPKYWYRRVTVFKEQNYAIVQNEKNFHICLIIYRSTTQTLMQFCLNIIWYIAKSNHSNSFNTTAGSYVPLHWYQKTRNSCYIIERDRCIKRVYVTIWQIYRKSLANPPIEYLSLLDNHRPDEIYIITVCRPLKCNQSHPHGWKMWP